MRFWRREPARIEEPGMSAQRVKAKYNNFRELLSVNNECLELMAGLQEDLQFVPPRRDVIEDRIAAIFSKVNDVVAALDSVTGIRHQPLRAALESQQQEVERYTAALQEFTKPRISAWLSEADLRMETLVGNKASMLGEIRKLGLAVPDGFSLTTEAYRQYVGIPLWKTIRDATRDLDFNDLDALRRVSRQLSDAVMAEPVPRAIEVAITARVQNILKNGGALAVRSSAIGEGGAKSAAGQYLSILNVPAAEAVDAYKQIIAARFSEQALFYRLSTGMSEVDNPMAALFLLVVPAKASGIMYTRDPSDLKSKALWITATRGLGLDIASGRMPADLFLVSHSRPHTILERNIVHKEEELVVQDGGGVVHRPLPPGAQDEASLQDGDLHTLAEWGARLEQRFQTPQDIEWVMDHDGRIWIVQSRALVNTGPSRSSSRVKPKVEPKLTGGRTICPGQTSGPAFLAEELQHIRQAPKGSVVFIRKPSPEIVEVFPRIAGLVAEWGNPAGHAAALLREFKVPSVFQMAGAFGRVANGELVSLDAVQSRIYPGILWPPSRMQAVAAAGPAAKKDPVTRRLLRLHLLDPAAANFCPAGCESAHDVLRYCHEKAIGAMFAVNDSAMEDGAQGARQLVTSLPLNVQVMDLGGGMAPAGSNPRQVSPEQILSRPFRALWKGISHPGVTFLREMPARISDLASVLAHSITPQDSSMRALGDKSYLLVADEYMNFNTRLAYHYSLVDACLSDAAGNNYISFRFEGGGATEERRGLRACFLERCLLRYGFQVDRRSDLVNAWYRKAPAGQTEERLDILGRLLGCTSQLDMYMTSREVMNWYVDQFLSGNYAFRQPET
ncbi:MAG TPA: PEP/pyruvate-binding domain-containing protein [Bryobacteraceae bacterium]|nr:PEP/pyruvate-binding domain-containing protein [Bryobacteraceae bacterium]